MARSRVLILLIILCVGLLSTPASAAAGSDADEFTEPAQAASESIHITQTLKKTPRKPGQIEVTVAATVDLSVDEFYIFLPESGVPIQTDNFDESTDKTRPNRTTYEWDGSSTQAAVTYELAVNNTRYAAAGSKTVDTGEWALLDVPNVGWWWSTPASDPETPTVRTEIAGSGALADEYAYLGTYSMQSHSAHDQDFRLIIPEAANLSASPQEIFDSLAYAAGELRVGARDPTVSIIVAPTAGNWTGTTVGRASDAGFWAVDTARVGSAGDTWIHEYVHTRQNFSTTDDFTWFKEGSAEYYSTLYPLQRAQIDWVRFRNYLTRAPRDEQTAILTEPKSGPAPSRWYTKGGVVAARSDYELRRATGGEASLQRVIEQLNAEPDEVSNADYIQYIDSYTDEETTSSIRAATTTPKTEVVWSGNEHSRVFGSTPHGFEPADDATEKSQETDDAVESNDGDIDTDQGGNAYSDGKANSRLGDTIQRAIVTVGISGIVIGLLLFRKRLD